MPPTREVTREVTGAGATRTARRRREVTGAGATRTARRRRAAWVTVTLLSAVACGLG